MAQKNYTGKELAVSAATFDGIYPSTKNAKRISQLNRKHRRILASNRRRGVNAL